MWGMNKARKRNKLSLSDRQTYFVGLKGRYEGEKKKRFEKVKENDVIKKSSEKSQIIFGTTIQVSRSCSVWSTVKLTLMKRCIQASF